MAIPRAQVTQPAEPFSRGVLLHVCDAVLTQLAGLEIDGGVVHLDRLIAAVAARQHGIVTREQLGALGAGRGAIAARVDRGLLLPLHRGVFAWIWPAIGSIERGASAVYACGDGAVLSGHVAAAAWAFRPALDDTVDLTIAGRRDVRHAGIRVHRCTALTSADIRRLDGVPITSPARTMLDITPTLTDRELEEAVERAQVDRLITKHDMLSMLDRAPGRAGSSRVRAVIAEPVFTRSRAERLLVGLVRSAGLPRPDCNTIIEGLEVDAAWRPERLILEFDSYAFHATRAAFERDRRKDAVVTRAGYFVLRTTWRELVEQPYALVARIAEALVRRREPT